MLPVRIIGFSYMMKTQRLYALTLLLEEEACFHTPEEISIHDINPELRFKEETN